MEARTIAVQVSEQLFTRLKNVVTWKGCKQKEFLISVIEQAIEEIPTGSDEPYWKRNRSQPAES